MPMPETAMMASHNTDVRPSGITMHSTARTERKVTKHSKLTTP